MAQGADINCPRVRVFIKGGDKKCSGVATSISTLERFKLRSVAIYISALEQGCAKLFARNAQSARGVLRRHTRLRPVGKTRMARFVEAGCITRGVRGAPPHQLLAGTVLVGTRITKRQERTIPANGRWARRKCCARDTCAILEFMERAA